MRRISAKSSKNRKFGPSSGIELKTMLITASLVGGGAISGVTGLDANAIEAVHEAMGNAPEFEAVTEVETEIETEVEVDADAEEIGEGASEAATPPAPEAEAAASAVPHPGRRALGAPGRGAMHRSERATSAHGRAAARSPLTNAGAEHRNGHATSALERASDRSASRPRRGPSAGRGMNSGKGRGPRS